MWSGTNLKTSLFTSAQVFTLASRRLTSTDLNICAELNSATWLADTQPMFPTWLHVEVLFRLFRPVLPAQCDWVTSVCFLHANLGKSSLLPVTNSCLPPIATLTCLKQGPLWLISATRKCANVNSLWSILVSRSVWKHYCWARPDLAVRGSALPQWIDHNQNTG